MDRNSVGRMTFLFTFGPRDRFLSLHFAFTMALTRSVDLHLSLPCHLISVGGVPSRLNFCLSCDLICVAKAVPLSISFKIYILFGLWPYFQLVGWPFIKCYIWILHSPRHFTFSPADLISSSNLKNFVAVALSTCNYRYIFCFNCALHFRSLFKLVNTSSFTSYLVHSGA